MQRGAYGAEAMKAFEDGLAQLHAHDALSNVRVCVFGVILLGWLYSLHYEEHLACKVNLVEV
jgi:hypothetical protein